MSKINLMLNLAEQSALTHQPHKDWWKEQGGEQFYRTAVLLIMTEVGELVEAWRKKDVPKEDNLLDFYKKYDETHQMKLIGQMTYTELERTSVINAYEQVIKNTVPEELADLQSRVLDLLGFYHAHIDWDDAQELYEDMVNQTRKTVVAIPLPEQCLVWYDHLLRLADATDVERIVFLAVDFLAQLQGFARSLNLDLDAHFLLKRQYHAYKLENPHYAGAKRF